MNLYSKGSLDPATYYTGYGIKDVSSTSLSLFARPHHHTHSLTHNFVLLSSRRLHICSYLLLPTLRLNTRCAPSPSNTLFLPCVSFSFYAASSTPVLLILTIHPHHHPTAQSLLTTERPPSFSNTTFFFSSIAPFIAPLTLRSKDNQLVIQASKAEPSTIC